MNSIMNARTTALSRREFIQVAATAGGLLLMASLPEVQAQEAQGRAPAMRNISAFIHIAQDGTITITTPSVEMGQGAHTAIPMIVMEELEGDWSRLVVKDAAAAADYNNPMMGRQTTVGSFSIRGWYNDLRKIGAAARAMLVQAAADQWSVPASDCTVSNGVITHASSGRQTGFGAVANQAATLPVPQNPVLKAVPQFKLIGGFKSRTDVPVKVDGSARYGSDVRLPDMVYATVKACPTFGGKVKNVDDSATRQVSGYIATVPMNDAVIVVARSFWQAKKASELLKVEYDLGKLADLDNAKITAQLRDALAKPGTVTRNDGDATKAFNAAASQIEADYEAPYLAHACMEPMSCVAQITANGCEVWCGTQSPQDAQQAAATVLGIPAARVNVNVMYLGGGFGRRGESDFVTHAVTAAKAVGRPVKLVWTREEDIQHDYYRPAAMVRLRAGFDETRKLVTLEGNMVTASAPGFGGLAFTSQGVADATYNVANFRVTDANADIGIRFGFLRSVNHSHHPFMMESFIDEAAYHAKQDPYRFRRALLQHEAGVRQARLLDVLAEKSNWGKCPKGHFQGIAALHCYDSFVGAVAEVSIRNKQITLHRMIMAIDCGIAVYPDNIRAQLEGSMVYGLTAALRGEITFDKGAVKQSNFHDYPMLLMSEMPLVEVIVVPSTAAPGGVGEPGTAAVAPALTNALFAATGQRIRSLPLSRHGYSFAVSRA
jgi:isoquinoline 1-oxidoreductase subunit beta